jgi:rSAM/selenodomain-associated transferase 2
VNASPTAPARDRISVIVPTLNEQAWLRATLERARTGRDVELIVADGGSTDSTKEVASAIADVCIDAARGRAAQMNAGAAIATGELLLFLHADTLLPEGFDECVRTHLAHDHVAAGAFRLGIDSPRRVMRWVEWGANARSKWLRRPYGDQAIFVRASIFRRVRGYRELPIMEDYDFVRRLRRVGRVATIECAVTTSARRWERAGLLRTTLTHQLCVIGYALGVPPARLAALRTDSEH